MAILAERAMRMTFLKAARLWEPRKGQSAILIKQNGLISAFAISAFDSLIAEDFFCRLAYLFCALKGTQGTPKPTMRLVQCV